MRYTAMQSPGNGHWVVCDAKMDVIVDCLYDKDLALRTCISALIVYRSRNPSNHCGMTATNEKIIAFGQDSPCNDPNGVLQ